MRHAPLCALGLIAFSPAAAHAEDWKLTPSIEARLRYEHVDQAGLPEQANALTLRARPGVTASVGGWSALIEAESVVGIVDDYNDGLNGRAGFPVVADPENIEINRAQLRYVDGAIDGTAGRQRVALADERFVGTAPWRQSEQTFDAARIRLGKPQGIGLDLTYGWNVRTVNGRRCTGARPTDIGGDNLFALAHYATRHGTLTGFAYLVDQDLAAVQGFRLSSQTYGLRFAGATTVRENLKLGYAASWARQSDWHHNPNRYAATYWFGEATLTGKALAFTAGYEELGADEGRPLTSVQTPLASAFKFNGWAGKFTTTPPNGLRDHYAALGYGWKKTGPFDAVNLSAALHRFDSDRADQHYGDEIDLLAAAKRGRYALSARYAHYRASAFATDTDKFWLQVDWSL